MSIRSIIDMPSPGGRQCIQAKCKSIPRARGRRQIDPLQRTDPACLISLPASWSFSADPKRRQCTRLDCAARDSLQVPPRIMRFKLDFDECRYALQEPNTMEM